MKLVICAVLVLALSGCAAGKYVECIARDATSRPCN